MNNKKQANAGFIGFASILVVFVLLCLVTFATLSLVTANANYILSTKSSNNVNEYYTACNQAEQSFKQLDNLLVECYNKTTSKQEYLEKVQNTFKNNSNFMLSVKNEDLYIRFTVDINERQKLYCEAEVLYPEDKLDTFYNITQYKTADEGEWTPDDKMPVLQTGGLPSKK